MPAFAAGAANAMPRTAIALASAQTKLPFLSGQNRKEARMVRILELNCRRRNTPAMKLCGCRPNWIASTEQARLSANETAPAFR